MKTDREKLIDFFLYMEREGLIVERIDCSKVIINYEKSINKALDETKTVNNNECQRKVCYPQWVEKGTIGSKKLMKCLVCNNYKQTD